MDWYALYTRPRHEKRTHDLLREKNIDAFLPMVKQLRQWKDRRRWVEMPLFNSYVFVHVDLKDRIYVLETHGVVRLVGFGGTPARIPAWQIEQLKTVITHGEKIESEEYLKIGDYVEIEAGPMRGVKGYLREIRGESRLAILVDGIYQSTSFVVERGLVRKIEEESCLGVAI